MKKAEDRSHEEQDRHQDSDKQAQNAPEDREHSESLDEISAETGDSMSADDNELELITVEKEKLEKDLADLNDKYLRLVAEFDNFRKRTSRERSDLLKHAGEDTMKSLLDVLDDMNRAAAPVEGLSDSEILPEGVRLIFSKLSRILNGKGLKMMESKGELFNEELHEAVAEVPTSKPEDEGRILDVVQPGYFLNDKIIRHAKVVVGKKSDS